MHKTIQHLLVRSFDSTTIIVLITAFCALVFLASLVLPRADGQLIGSDGIRYYSYLPSFWIDHDLDLTDEYLYFVKNGNANLPVSSEFTTPKGLPPNQWPFGPAIFWSPFFLLAHLSAHLLNGLGLQIPTDGYGNFYQTFVLLGNIILGGFGLWFVYRFTSHITSEKAALYSTLMITFAGNYVYYMTAEPFMAHNLSLLLSSLFFYVWYQRKDQADWQTAALLGFIGGLMALVRPQDGLFLCLPFIIKLPGVWNSLRGLSSPISWQTWLFHCLVAGLVALLTFSIQFWVWNEIYGASFINPYFYQESDVLFYWFLPKLGAVLFSAYRGLVVWHPIFLLALLGLGLTYKHDRTVAFMGITGFIIQWYIVSSWHVWFQGDAFGGRMFIVCTPMFVVGLASLAEWAAKRWSWKLLYTAGSLIIAWNFLLFIEYRFDLVTSERIPNWYDLTIRRIIFPFEVLRRRLA